MGFRSLALFACHKNRPEVNSSLDALTMRSKIVSPILVEDCFLSVFATIGDQ